MELKQTENGPLSELRVLDLSRHVAGNMLTKVLADMGAEVIKVERPGQGDTLRAWRVEGVSTYWKVYARNKKSITLNLKHDEGRELLLRLVEGAAVFCENFRPGTLERLGLGPDVLMQRNSELVVVRVSGWGQTGPYAERAGFGTLIEALSGFAARNGFPDKPPLLPPLALADMVAGLYGAMAALSAVRQVEVRQGAGQVIDLSLLEPLFSILGPQAANYKLTGEVPERTGNRLPDTAPRNIYQTGDGRWLAISASTQATAERLFRALGLEELIDDPRFKTNTNRVENVKELDARLQERIFQRTLDENLQAFAESGVTAGPVCSIDDFLENPHVQAREVVVEVPDPDLGSLPMHSVVPRLSETPGTIRRPAPKLGEHNEELLTELGFGPEEVDGFVSEGIM
jgi:crotonobetainyl-CoA:carnitine CoA-transferase CaiB-like acyl-CoA transferase